MSAHDDSDINANKMSREQMCDYVRDITHSKQILFASAKALYDAGKLLTQSPHIKRLCEVAFLRGGSNGGYEIDTSITKRLGKIVLHHPCFLWKGEVRDGRTLPYIIDGNRYDPVTGTFHALQEIAFVVFIANSVQMKAINLPVSIKRSNSDFNVVTNYRVESPREISLYDVIVTCPNLLPYLIDNYNTTLLLSTLAN